MTCNICQEEIRRWSEDGRMLAANHYKCWKKKVDKDRKDEEEGPWKMTFQR